jgi:hypothetical protein
MDNEQVVIEQEVAPVIEVTPPVKETPAALSPEKIDEIQRKAYGYAFGQVDTRLAELGYIKPDGVKTTDYLVELLKENKSTGTKEPVIKVDDVELGTKVKELQNLLREKETELETVKSSVNTQKRDLFVDSLINTAPITVPDHLSEQEKTRMLNRTKALMKSELTTNYDIREIDGQFRFYQKDGSPVLDGTVDMNPIAPTSLLSKEFSEFLKSPKPTPVQVKGTGVTDGEVQGTERIIPAKVKSASEFYTYLREDLKLTMGSKEFMDKIGDAKKERPAMFS